ncbi:hypothetical protein V8E54_006921 [Elaphomyces granulatus]
MPGRTQTANQSIWTLRAPDNRKYDFTDSPNAPHVVRITVPKGSTYKGSKLYWNETYGVLLKCVQGQCHTFRGTGPYSNSDDFFGPPFSETYPIFEVHSWQKWPTESKNAATEELSTVTSIATDLECAKVEKGQQRTLEGFLGEKGDVSSTEITSTSTEGGDLVVELSPSTEPWDQAYGPRHELFYRNWASMELDAELYPTLPTTPLPIRLLFKLPWFLFPKALRDQLISWFLSVQLFVIYSAFDHHPDLGSLPIMFIYGLLYFPKYWLPFGPRIPDWVCRWQWTNMIVMSHLKIAFWSRVGRWLLAMNPVYKEYTPERLKHALDPMPGEENFPAGGRHFTDSMV